MHDPSFYLMKDQVLAAIQRRLRLADDLSPRCPDCWHEIDPTCCHCGTGLEGHNDYSGGHSFVPNGCTCCYHDQTDRKNPEPGAEFTANAVGDIRFLLSELKAAKEAGYR